MPILINQSVAFDCFWHKRFNGFNFGEIKFLLKQEALSITSNLIPIRQKPNAALVYNCKINIKATRLGGFDYNIESGLCA